MGTADKTNYSAAKSWIKKAFSRFFGGRKLECRGITVKLCCLLGSFETDMTKVLPEEHKAKLGRKSASVLVLGQPEEICGGRRIFGVRKALCLHHRVKPLHVMVVCICVI